MKRIQNIALLTLCILGLSLILGLVTSRQVRAAVSALVTVTNDATNPVPTSITNTYLNPIAVNLPTHIGVAPSKFVSLNCASFTTSTSTSPGSISPTGITLPVHHLVDECSDWYLNNVGGAGQDGYSVPSGYELIITDIEIVASSTAGNGLHLDVKTGPGSGQSSVLRDFTAFNSHGDAVFREHLITGFACTALPDVMLDESQAGGLSGPTNTPYYDIQGYLVPAS